MPAYRVNQQVRYKPVGGAESKTSESVGIIRDVITQPGNLTGRNVHASPSTPRYEVENAHTHKRSAIKEENIIERI
ncbi:hypothetical protein VTN31DRAFT_16 [Thermomyces dupontii]|uniref:uncharacterized protein n=1 Tax=Talaromyces thermophilus TaxID=28565 RepID=UPI0037445577